MGKQPETMPNEPLEAPVRGPQPKVEQPKDPNTPGISQEAPQQPVPQPELQAE